MLFILKQDPNPMKKIIFIITVVILYSCSSTKKTQVAINSGDYSGAINTAISKLSHNKTKKGNQDLILLLEEVFKKNTERELKDIKFSKKDGNPANHEKIYNKYLALNAIQERIAPLLPLNIYKEDREASFKFKDYTDNIVASKNDLSDYLYTNASMLISSASNKFDYRQAFEDFNYLEKINPNYKDTKNKIEEAYQKGIDYVNVALFNDSEIALPKKLEKDLLNFNTYDLDNMWTRFHTNKIQHIDYDYEMKIRFISILISPERIENKHIIKEKQVKDGWKYTLDESGNVRKDSLGNDIKVDKFKTIRCDFYEHIQQKDVKISGDVSYFDLKTKQQLNSYPLTSGFVFEYIYADYQGDKRALNDDMLGFSRKQAVPFPSNEQMVYDSGEDLKNNLKAILKRYEF